MKRTAAILVLALAGPLAADEKRTFDFDAEPSGSAPAGWGQGLTGEGRPGRWVIEDGETMGGTGKVLVQRDSDPTSGRCPLAFAPGISLSDGSITVRCRPIWGTVDQGCGVFLRARDGLNYVVARANALEDNVRIYDVTNGTRTQFGSWDGPVATGTWHTLGLSARGDQYVVTFDGKEVLRARSGKTRGPGRVGLWTKADSLIAFDDVVVESVR